MIIPEITIDSGFATLIAAAIATFLSINTFFFSWLRSNFNHLSSKVEQADRNTTILLDKHEDLDQKRHEENLRRFEKVSVALARLGHTNGS